jgi:hypothetical protein
MSHGTFKMLLPAFQDPRARFTTKLQALEKIVICLIKLHKGKLSLIDEVTCVDHTNGFGEQFEGFDVAFEPDAFHAFD